MNNEIETTTEDQITDGQDLEGSSIETEAVADKAKAEAAWIAFNAAITAHAQGLGLEVKDQKSFVQFVNTATSQKLYVAKGARAVKRVDTTMPLIGVLDGAYPLEKPNGKIECHVPADVESVKAALTLLAGEQFGNLRASKRAPSKSEAPAAE